MPTVNRAVEQLKRGQPIYYGGAGELSYEKGVEASGRWEDYLVVEMEHGLFDLPSLKAFMTGLADGGPAPTGHLTPCIIVTLPTNGTSEAVMRANAWMVKQLLALGVHGLLLCHAETPDAVCAFVEAARYPFQTRGVGADLGVGQRGSGGQGFAARTWGLPVQEYVQRADVWPLNPDGELILGLKIENQRALANVDKSLAVPGIAFAEWGPGDMGMSFGYPDGHDPPYPPEMIAARNAVLKACKVNGVAFLDGATPENVTDRIDEGVMVSGCSREAAEIGKRHTGRDARNPSGIGSA
ncbi:MAG: hypothetical protein F4014_13805 [Gemmatimonadetes bacterium]|nr:hypothetical protein [Gemmatimonadota bacterium]MYH18968.1 hypothetical protein [Gemmatimonadota bacterium]MYK99824.1 hypothetical protein [Gemmatimonadota bacterium]